MSGYELRLGRLFNGETGRSFITAIDHAVTLGVPEGDWIEIIGDVRPGQKVVVAGNERLRPGQPVQMVEHRSK